MGRYRSGAEGPGRSGLRVGGVARREGRQVAVVVGAGERGARVLRHRVVDAGVTGARRAIVALGVDGGRHRRVGLTGRVGGWLGSGSHGAGIPGDRRRQASPVVGRAAGPGASMARWPNRPVRSSSPTTTRPPSPSCIAIKGGDVDGLAALLAERPELARALVVDASRGPDGRSALHLVADWPGHLPHGAEMVRLLVAAGADVDARPGPGGGETALHWAASADDVEVLDALLDAGADIEAPGAVIAGGPPLADAVAFGQWQAARRLVERGARVPLREGAALGRVADVERHLADAAVTAEDVDQAFWYACHGGEPVTAELLAARGAHVDWVSPWDGLSPLAAAERTAGELTGDGRSRVDRLIAWLRDRGARSAGDAPAG